MTFKTNTKLSRIVSFYTFYQKTHVQCGKIVSVEKFGLVGFVVDQTVLSHTEAHYPTSLSVKAH